MRPNAPFLPPRQRLLLALGVGCGLAGIAVGALAGFADRGAPHDVSAETGAPILLAGLILFLTTGLGLMLALRLGRSRRAFAVRAPRESSK